MANPVATQPAHRTQGVEIQWMQKPSGPAGCPPGLEYLTQIDQLLCKQQIELLELITGFETKNRFRVFNSMGQQVYFAQEESTCAQRYFCGNGRGFVYHITDNNNQEVLRFRREFKCCVGWSCCITASGTCAFELIVEDANGEVLGYVRQARYCCKPKLEIFTASRDLLGTLMAPCCMCKSKCCGDIEIPLMAPDNITQIGKVAKQWSGGAQEFFTDADNFCVSFPQDMDVKAKAVMFGAVFLTDMMFFEDNGDNNNSWG